MKYYTVNPGNNKLQRWWPPGKMYVLNKEDLVRLWWKRARQKDWCVWLFPPSVDALRLQNVGSCLFFFIRDWCFRLTPVTQMTPSKSSHLDQFIWSGSKVWTWLRTTTPLIIATYPFPPRGYAENSIPSQSRALAPFISGNNTTAAGLKEAILTLRHRS